MVTRNIFREMKSLMRMIMLNALALSFVVSSQPCWLMGKVNKTKATSNPEPLNP